MNSFINVRHPVYATLSTDDATTGVTYSKKVELAPAMEVGFSPSSNTSTLYGNGVKQINVVKVGEEEITLGTNYLNMEDEAALGGHSYTAPSGSGSSATNAKIVRKDTDKAPYVGFGVTMDCEDGYCLSTWYYKVKFQDVEKSVKQSEDSYEFSTPSLTGSAVANAKAVVSESVLWKPESGKEAECPNYETLFGLTISGS